MYADLKDLDFAYDVALISSTQNEMKTDKKHQSPSKVRCERFGEC